MEKGSGAKELLDKVTLQSLHLMEEKLEREIAFEAAVNEGTFHLAKSRYIMGQNGVSSMRLPSEDSSEFKASLVCEHENYDGLTHLKTRENKDDTINPIKWFGVLVPQNLHRAQDVFRSALDYAVECANTHIRLSSVLQDAELLRNQLRQ